MSYNKVVFVCDYAANYAGNFIASLYSLANALQRRKKEALFVFPIAAKTKHWEIDLSQFNVKYCDIYSRVLTHIICSFVLPSDHAIIHLHFMRAFSLPLELKHYIRNRGLFVVHEHMIFGSNIKQRIKQIITGVLLRTIGPKNAIYIGVSPAVYQQLCQEVGKKKSRLVINAIDTKRLSSHTIHENNNVLIYGTHFERKGVDLAISALVHSRLASSITLQIVTHNKTEAKKRIIAKYGIIPSFITILPPSSNAESLYSNCFLFLSPSRLEAFGYAVVEAAYSGDQVIASDVPGQNTLRDIPGITWVEPENSKQLYTAIEKAYTVHTQARPDTAAGVQKYIREHYSLSNWIDNILYIYDHH